MMPTTRHLDVDEPARDAGGIFVAHAQRVAAWVGWLGGPEIDAASREEIVQDVFLTVQRLLPTFRGEARITTWLYQITANAVRHRRRKDRWRRLLSRTPHDDLAQLASPRLSPVEELERRQEVELAYRLLDRLPDRHRTALILFEFEGLSGEEIAERMSVNVSSIWAWLHRARTRLAKEARTLDRGHRQRGSR